MSTHKHPWLCEQETTFNLAPAKSGFPCEIYTCVPSEIKMVKKYAAEYPDQVKITKEDDIGIFAEAPRNWFNFKPPRKRHMTEEQKQELRNRLAAQREKRSNKPQISD